MCGLAQQGNHNSAPTVPPAFTACPRQAEAPAGPFLQGGDLAGAVVADASCALSLEQQQQLFMAQYHQQQMLFMQQQQALMAEHAVPGQAASGSHSVTVAGIDPGQAPAPPELAAEPAPGPALRSRRARRRRTVAADGGSEEGQDVDSGSEGETPKRQRRASGDGAPRRCARGGWFMLLMHCSETALQ